MGSAETTTLTAMEEGDDRVLRLDKVMLHVAADVVLLGARVHEGLRHLMVVEQEDDRVDEDAPV